MSLKKILIKRGSKNDLPVLESGEFGLVTDTNPVELYVGTSSGVNELVNKKYEELTQEDITSESTVQKLVTGKEIKDYVASQLPESPAVASWERIPAQYKVTGVDEDDQNIYDYATIQFDTDEYRFVAMASKSQYATINFFLLNMETKEYTEQSNGFFQGEIIYSVGYNNDDSKFEISIVKGVLEDSDPDLYLEIYGVSK